MSNVDHGRALANLCNKRSSIEGAIIKLEHQLQQLEENPTTGNVIETTNLLMEKIQVHLKLILNLSMKR